MKILIIRLSSIGDIVLASPLIRILRNRFKQARIDLLVAEEYKEILEANLHLNQIITFDRKTGLRGLLKLGGQIRRTQYDLVIDIHRKIRSRLISFISGAGQVITYQKRSLLRFLLVHFKLNLYREIIPVPELYLKPLKRLGLENDGGGLEFWIHPEKREVVATRLGQKGIKEEDTPLIALAPAAKWEIKRWPAESFIQVANQLAEKDGAFIALLGGPDDQGLCQEIADSIKGRVWMAAGELSLAGTAALLERSRLLITNDSGVMHIASAVGTPLVAIFGPTCKEFGFYPYGGKSVVLEKPLPCRPCTTIGRHRCKIGTHDCMRLISVEEVLEAVKGMEEVRVSRIARRT